MAYRRKSSSFRAKKRTGRFVKRGGARPRYPTKRRTYRKNPAMTKKRILNMTSVKKRDNMMCYTNLTTPSPDPAAAYITSGAVLPATTAGALNAMHPTVLVWQPTARDLTNLAGTSNPRLVEAARTSTTPYMVGLREVVEIQTPNGVPWQWRRICFTAKGSVPGLGSTSTFAPYNETSNGYVRLVNKLSGDRNSGATYDFFRVLFAGQNATDWIDPMTAKLDRSRISVRYDRTRTIAAGNESGTLRKYSMWHSMKKTLVYEDDENGPGMDTGYSSTTAKPGMGDFYVVDLIRSRGSAATTDYMAFNPSATLYWHEK